MIMPCYRIDLATGQRVAIVEPQAEGPRCAECGEPLSAAYCEQCGNFGVKRSLRCPRCRGRQGHRRKG